MAAEFLTDYRVLDLGQYVPGPYAALILADLGAQVVKVEPPGGDPMRRFGPVGEEAVSPFYKVMNGGKTVITLDLKTEDGARDFAALLRTADAMVESYRPGVLDRLGFGRAELEALNPRLVHCALSGYGQTGPYRLRAGHDLNYMALGGGLAASGTAAGPAISAPPVSDYASGVQAAAAVMAALLGRAKSGKGAYLDLSLAETVLAWQSVGLASMAHENFRQRLAGSLINGGLACYQIYRTADDRFLTLGALEDKFWANFCTALGRADWTPRQWEPMPQTSLIADVAAVIAEHPLAHWNALLDPVDCCYQAVVAFDELADHPQIQARGMLAGGVVSGQGGAPVEALFPAWIDGAPPDPRPPLREASAAAVIAAWGG